MHVYPSLVATMHPAEGVDSEESRKSLFWYLVLNGLQFGN